jgi:hypothetical protein
MSPVFKSWLQFVDEGQQFLRFALMSRTAKLQFT